MRRPLVLLAVSALAAGVVPAALADQGDGQPTGPIYCVGGASESINPPTSMLANSDFYLGGFGFGDGKPAGQSIPGVTDALGDRHATGVLGADPANAPDVSDADTQGYGVGTRAFAVSDGKATTVLAMIEAQGYFAAYKQGPFGLTEIREDAAKAIADLAATLPKPSTLCGQAALTTGDNNDKGDPVVTPAPTASQIVIDSDHSHGGPDDVGVWGGVPTAYVKFVHDQTVKAIVAAWQATRPATLWFGVAHAGVNGESDYPPSTGQGENPDWILNNQYNDDPNNLAMDDEIRVLQARKPGTHDVLDTYVNYGAHPDVLGSSNRNVTGDYPGRFDVLAEADLGGFVMDQVSTLGREQPERSSTCAGSDSDVAGAECRLDSYANRLLTKVHFAVDHATVMTGTPTVAMNSYFMADDATAPLLSTLGYGGAVAGVPLARAVNPPWYTGNVLGTTYFVGRIGSVLITGGPGEMYAQIWQKVKDTLAADPTSGVSDVMNIGTAGDFLGYIIAPLEAYPEPVYRSVASHDANCNGVPEPTLPTGGVCPDPIGNDNYFFNVSHTFGERLTCDFLRGAGDILAGDAQKYWSTYNRCAAFANDLVVPPGTDTTFPQQPDLTSLPTYDHL